MPSFSTDFFSTDLAEEQAKFIELVKIQVGRMMTPEAVADIDGRMHIEHHAMAVVMAVSRHILAIEDETISVSWPTNWWEAFKERFLQRFVRWGWLAEVRYDGITRKVYAAVCPHHVPARPENADGRIHLRWLGQADYPDRRGDYEVLMEVFEAWERNGFGLPYGPEGEPNEVIRVALAVMAAR